MTTVHLDRTIAAVREALPADERGEFIAVIDSTNVSELPHTFEYWYRRAVLNAAGLLERMKAGQGTGDGSGVPFDEAFPGARERWEQDRRVA
jgi:hypothetical protein